MGLFGITDFIRNFREASKPTPTASKPPKKHAEYAPPSSELVKFYTYNDAPLPQMRKGSHVVMQHVPGTYQLRSKYTGDVSESDCCFAYEGTIVGCVFALDARTQLLALQTVQPGISYRFVCEGRDKRGWLLLSLELPYKGWGLT